jgi:hypothetical protein
MRGGQNISSAVMAQRREPPDSLDDFPTPPWATRACVRHVLGAGLGIHADALRRARVSEPACNRGRMADPLKETFGTVQMSDVYDYGVGAEERDFLMRSRWYDVEWVVTNPPFNAAADFVERALEVAGTGVAIFARTAFSEGAARWRRLWRDRPPTVIGFHAERVILTKGRVRDPGLRYWDAGAAKWRRPSTATAYAWFVWVKGAAARAPVWIPPCRVEMERPGDYDAPEMPGEGALLDAMETGSGGAEAG